MIMKFYFNKIQNTEFTIVIYLLIILFLYFFIKKILKKKIFSIDNIFFYIVITILYLLILDFRIIINKEKYLFPKIPFIIDNSESMQFKPKIKIDNNNIISYYFGNQLTNKNIKFPTTDISNICKIFNYENEKYFNKILLYTDGNFDKSKISDVLDIYKYYNKKIFTLINDNVKNINDIGILKIKSNDYFLSDTVNYLNISINSNMNFKNIFLEFQENNVSIKNLNITKKFLDDNKNCFNFEFKPLNIGKNYYKFELKDFTDSNSFNNSFEFIKEVVSEEKNIYLIVNKPYYDYKYFKLSLNNFKNIKLFECKKFSNELIAQRILKNANLILFYNIRLDDFNSNEIYLLKEYFAAGKSAIFFLNREFDFNLFKVLKLSSLFERDIDNKFFSGDIKTRIKNNYNNIIPQFDIPFDKPPLEGYIKLNLNKDFIDLISTADNNLALISLNPKKNIAIISGTGFYKWHLNLAPLNYQYYIQDIYINIVKYLFESKNDKLPLSIELQKNNYFLNDVIPIKIIVNDTNIKNLNLELSHNNKILVSEKISDFKMVNYFNYQFNEYGIYKVSVRSSLYNAEDIFCIIKNLEELNQLSFNYANLKLLTQHSSGKIIKYNSPELKNYLKEEKIKIYAPIIINFKNNYVVIFILLSLISAIWLMDKFNRK